MLITLLLSCQLSEKAAEYALRQVTTYELRAMAVDLGKGKVERGDLGDTIVVTDEAVIVDSPQANRADGAVLERFVKSANREVVSHTEEDKGNLKRSKKSRLSGKTILFSANGRAIGVKPASDQPVSLVDQLWAELGPVVPWEGSTEVQMARVLSPYGCFYLSDLAPIKEAATSSGGPAMALTYLSPDQMFDQETCVAVAEPCSEPNAFCFTFNCGTVVNVGSLLDTRKFGEMSYSHMVDLKIKGRAEVLVAYQRVVGYVVKSEWTAEERILARTPDGNEVMCHASWGVAQELRIEAR